MDITEQMVMNKHVGNQIRKQKKQAKEDEKTFNTFVPVLESVFKDILIKELEYGQEYLQISRRFEIGDGLDIKTYIRDAYCVLTEEVLPLVKVLDNVYNIRLSVEYDKILTVDIDYSMCPKE